MNTFPERARWIAAVWLCSLAGSACGDEVPLQIVLGTVEQAALPMQVSAALAWRDETLVASSTLNADGRFALALPITDGLLLTLSSNQGPVSVYSDAATRICVPTEPLDLGTMLEAGPGAPSQCPPEPACLASELLLAECMAQSELSCGLLFDEVKLCREQRRIACEPGQTALDACLAGGGNCEQESFMLFECESAHPCGQTEQDYFDTCDAPCATELELRNIDCELEDMEPCLEGAPLEVIPENPLPADVGCDGAPQ